MVQPEVVCVSDTRDLPKEASTTKVVGLDVVDGRNPPQVGFIQANRSYGRQCQSNRRNQGPRLSESGFPVSRLN